MLTFKEIECLDNSIINLEGSPYPVRVYISLVDKWSNGIKMDNRSILLCHGAGFPENRNYLTMVGGNLLPLIEKIKKGSYPFKINNYDGTDFPNSYLAKLIPLVKIHNQFPYPKDILNWGYDVDSFDYIKKQFNPVIGVGFHNSQLSLQIKDKPKIYSLPGNNIVIPARKPDIKKETVTIKTFPEKLPLKVKVRTGPSNKSIVAYE